uniref:Uncharacterized protein n=2 Tax=Plectus sambesii TaxID=2011161 RepID=A0A914V7I4_9BILA
MQFCAPIASTEYEKQKKNMDDALEDLLDQIAYDENTSASDRRKKLKQFKKTYPHIYARRFPEDVEPKRKAESGIGLVKRLKLLRF